MMNTPKRPRWGRRPTFDVAAFRRESAATAVALWRSLRLIWEADPPRALAHLLLVVAIGVVPVAVAWLAKLTLDRLTAAVTAPHPDAALVGSAFTIAVWYVVVQFASRLLSMLDLQLQGNIGIQVTGYVDTQMIRAGAAIPDLDHFERQEFQDELAFLQREVNYRPVNLLGFLQNDVHAVLGLVGGLGLLVHLQPVLPLVLLLGAIPQVLVRERQGRRIYQSITDRSDAARRMAYCMTMMLDAAAAKEMLIFALGPWFRARWQGLAGEALAETARLRRAGLRGTLAIVLGNGLIQALSFAYVALQVSSHRLTIGDFALYLSVISGMQQSLTLLSFSLAYAHESLRFMARMFAFLDHTRPSIAVAPIGTGIPVPVRLRWELELREVAFAYPGQPEPVLRDVTCTLAAGEVVAVVGLNGAGKTTLVKLLTRLYDPTAGQVLLDGVPLAQYDLTALRQRISVLFQDFTHFPLSAQHNIGVGDAPHADDRERVLAAAARTGADTVLAKLPKGLDTQLTRAFEGGVDLSGGEWQKIATARAAMRDAALVILDEPTAALDAQAEYNLFQRFRELAAGRTVLLISHRFSTVRMADRILVLEGGRITEAGTHDELIALGGRYATLHEMQAGRYR